MTIERKLNLIIIQLIKINFLQQEEFSNFIKENYNLKELDSDYIPLLMEFLNDYALNTTEKSD